MNNFRLQSICRLPGAILLTAALVACGSPRPEAESSGSATANFNVVTTFLPITLFTRAVAGECATVTALIPPNLGPHDFQARPGDIALLSKASVLVKNGLEMEHFLDKLTESAGNDDLTIIDTSAGIAVIESDEEDDHHDDHHDDIHDDHGQREGHDHGDVNPHIWLDPLRAVQQIETIRDGLVDADPSCKEGYTTRAAAYTTQLKQLNSEIAAQLKPYRGKTFIAFHDFAPYFAQRYELKADYVVDVPEINPTPADLQRVSEQVKSTQLKALLSEPQEGASSFNALAEDLGVTVITFDPLETGSEQASQNPETYLEVMRRNVVALLQALGG